MTWVQAGDERTAVWLSANDRLAPQRIIPVTDELTADDALKNASQGIAMLWLGDFHNAKQILGAIDRRLANPGKKKTNSSTGSDGEKFYKIRQARAQRSRVMSLILVPLNFDSAGGYIPLPRAPQVDQAVEFGYGDHAGFGSQSAVVSLQELTGILSAHQWFINGVDVPSLGARIHPHYGTFLPTRHEYVDLVAQAPLPSLSHAFDIGTGTGVLGAVLVDRGVKKVVGTDLHQRAVDCANDNFYRLGMDAYAHAELTNMFPDGTAPLIVCNPPWLPGNATTSLDAAVYDPSSQMLLQFLEGLPGHLTANGEGWLILSDLAELLGLRTREMLLGAVAQAGLEIIDRLDTAPTHGRSQDTSDVLHAARSREITSLWRLRRQTP